MIVADNETAVDLLYYEAVAKTVVRVVSEKSDEPLSVGVHGDWGAGKSSILMMSKNRSRTTNASCAYVSTDGCSKGLTTRRRC